MTRLFLTTFTLFSITFVSRVTRADDDFSTHKTKIIAEMDERIQKMQEHRSCVNGAASREAMKDCHEKMKSWRESEHKENLGKRRAHIDEKIKNLEEQKKKLDAPK